MKFHKNRFLTTVSAAALVLTVGACSSSSDDGTVAAAAPPPATTEPAPEPTPELTPAEQLAAAEAAVTIAEALVAALTSSSTGDEAGQAYAALGAAQTALHAVTSMPANQIAALQAQISQLALDLEAANATPPTETVALEQAQADAVTAAAAAMEAATAAKVASDAAQTAIENLATLQTGETSRDLAHAAYMQSKAAADAAAEAQTASDDAAEATDGVAATRLLVLAETARDNAVEAKGIAETQGAAAMAAAAMAELIIDGKDKNVGGTSLNADDGATDVTTNGVSVITGRIKDRDPMHKDIPAVVGDGVPDLAVAGVGFTADTAYVQAVAVREFSIGRTLDTSDDMARLMLVTHYAGSKSVKVYADSGGVNLIVTRASDGTLTDNGNSDAVVTLKSVGRYYLAGVAVSGDGLDANDLVADDAKAKEVFSYDVDGTPAYVVLDTTTVGDDDDVVSYQRVDITATTRGVEDEDGGEQVPMTQVTATIPEATEYKHIHFGVWAALGAAEEDDGMQMPSNLGIGFVQNYSGGGLTSIGGTSDDMPNSGDATYNGNWVAAVQGADEDGNGDITLLNNAAELTADFGKATISADLTGLATLTGDIAGNTFSGTKAKLAASPMGGLTAADFTGSFSGGFYGAKAVEAGGIFDFTSEDAENGAFRGAFGGKK